jgi:hypothetical protein
VDAARLKGDDMSETTEQPERPDEGIESERYQRPQTQPVSDPPSQPQVDDPERTDDDDAEA